MKKKIFITTAILILSLNSFGNGNTENRTEREQKQYGKNYMVVGALSNIRGKGEIKVKPDILINTFELKTENESLEKASEENAKTMNEFKKYLLSIGVKESDIETSRYSKNTETVKKSEDEKEKIYETSFSVSLYIPNDKYYNVTEIINKENINELTHIRTNSTNQEVMREFQFVIEALDKDKDTSKKLAKDKYDRITKEIKNLGLQEPVILNYSNEESAKEETKKIYTITHAYTVKIPATADIGKLLKKCETLKIKNPGAMTYDMSEELREKATLEAYEKAMNNIYTKAKVILKNQGYDLGDASIVDQTNDYPIPLNNFGRNYGVVMNQNFNGQMTPVNTEIEVDEGITTGIPFSAVQEMKVTVNLLANFEIIKKAK